MEREQGRKRDEKRERQVRIIWLSVLFLNVEGYSMYGLFSNYQCEGEQVLPAEIKLMYCEKN